MSGDEDLKGSDEKSICELTGDGDNLHHGNARGLGVESINERLMGFHPLLNERTHRQSISGNIRE